MTRRRFAQVDVFTDEALLGNPVAVVLDGDGLDDDEMQRFAAWTDLSETTFVVAPIDPDADYRVRIFTPASELPFAGHPTLGTCHAWLAAGGEPAAPDRVVQECGIGLVELRRDDGLAFAAPDLLRAGPVDGDVAARVLAALGVGHDDVDEVRWVDNGPGWIGVLLHDVARLRSLRPRLEPDLFVGVAALLDPPDVRGVSLEVRAFFPVGDQTREDPVTGSLNASLARWLLDTGRISAPYVASQGTALGRDGRVRVDRDADGTTWVGGASTTVVTGEVVLGG